MVRFYTLLQVTVEAAAEVDRAFDILMGEAVNQRKRFLQTHARLLEIWIFKGCLKITG
jgi:DNA gyrase/topoisomerase IV subunit B